jgi:hypothetical protein
MPDDFNQADILDIKSQPSFLIGLNFCAVAVGKLQSPKAVGFLKTRVAHFFAFLQPVKEALKGFIKAAQNLLGGGEVEKRQFFVGNSFLFQFSWLGHNR